MNKRFELTDCGRLSAALMIAKAVMRTFPVACLLSVELGRALRTCWKACRPGGGLDLEPQAE